MAGRTGTLIINPVRIQDDTIPQPVAYVNELQGGAQSGPALSDRDAVPTYLRQWGMFFTVYNNGANSGTYVLTYNNVDTNISNNGNWKLFAGAGGSSGVKKLDQAVLGSGSINIPGPCLLLMVLVNASSDLTLGMVGYNTGTDEIVMMQPMSTGFNPFMKGIFYPASTTIVFSGITTQSTCSAIILQF
jgi:hypothetical protein